MQSQPTASTSTLTAPAPAENDSSSCVEAPLRELPSQTFYSVEYPGYVQDSSVPQAVHNLGGLGALENAFRRTTKKEEALVDLKLRPDNPFAHPIPGDVAVTQAIVLKVVKRKRKRKEGAPSDDTIGEYTAEAVGVVPKTLRFRSMADFQYEPDPNDPVVQLRHAMLNMDVEAIRKYRIPPEKADYMVPAEPTGEAAPADSFAMDVDPQLLADSVGVTTSPAVPPGDVPMRSNLRLVPPPIFSRQGISQLYNFKANPTSVVSTTVDEETGEEKKRLINRMRWKGFGPVSVPFSDNTLPDKPLATTEQYRRQVDQNMLAKVQAVFEDRPIWTRQALLNQFSAAESRDIINSKLLLPLVSYVFQDGPWRDTLVRFNYDPRTDPEARIYQRIYFRNANHPINRPSVITRKQERSAAAAASATRTKDEERRRAHIFDGKSVTKETAAFQLCDIEDPLLRRMIEAPDSLRDTCDERDGWYTAHTLERIKIVLRHKFFTAMDGYPASDEDCLRLLDTAEEMQASHRSKATMTKLRLQPGKHNMAKGALRPEDAAALRLRATLDRNVRNRTS